MRHSIQQSKATKPRTPNYTIGHQGGPRDWWLIVKHWDQAWWPDATTLDGWTVGYHA